MIGHTYRRSRPANRPASSISAARTGVCGSRLAAMFTDGGLKAVPIVEPEAEHLVGLITAKREPQTPVLAALIDEATRLAGRLRR